MDSNKINIILKENDKHSADMDAVYNPYLGIGSPLERIPLIIDEQSTVNIPFEMSKNKLIHDILIAGSLVKFLDDSIKVAIHQTSNAAFASLFYLINIIRNKYDFEFWAATTIKIKDKETGALIPFILNKPQRKCLKTFEKLRKLGPIRIILLKARQWGGSTFTEFFAVWLQIIHHKNWNSCIIGDIDDQARTIKGMYSTAAEEYPAEIGSMTLKPFERSSNITQIVESGSIIYIGSMQHPNSIRSSDPKIAHYTEVGSWKDTPGKKPSEIIGSINMAIPFIKDTMIVMESTAKGIGNFFHKMWTAAKNGEGYEPIFVAWFEIERCRLRFKDETEKIKFIEKMTEHNLLDWDNGATLEGLNWYNTILQTECNGDTVMMEGENPSDEKEAFQSTGNRVFSKRITQRAAKNCIKPLFRGILTADGDKGEDALINISYDEYFSGLFYLWSKPDKTDDIKNRYLVSLDIGGTTMKADYSVIRVFDRYWMMDGGVPEAIGTWRFHIDQDKLAWIAARTAEYFNHALLVIESNSLHTQQQTEGGSFFTILEEIKDYYDNIYVRKSDPEKIVEGNPTKFGFHTNKSTKPEIINALKAAMRDGGYVEKDIRLIDEADMFEHKINGKMGAVDGEHDDILMNTAIGLWVCLNDMPLPKIINRRPYKQKTTEIKGLANF